MPVGERERESFVCHRDIPRDRGGESGGEGGERRRGDLSKRSRDTHVLCMNEN